MLHLKIPSLELYDQEKNLFFNSKEQELTLEHSLVSLSKWESKWKKPFLSNEHKTLEETIDYIRCMTITQNVDPEVYNYLTGKIIDEVNEYIGDSMTATTFSKKPGSAVSREIITAEIIYFWMFNYNIPMECQKWHLNRLLAQINVCSEKSKPAEKIGRKEWLERQRSLNAARKAKYHTHG